MNKKVFIALALFATIFIGCENASEPAATTDDPFAGASNVLQTSRTALFSDVIDVSTKNPVIDQISEKLKTTGTAITAKNGFVCNNTPITPVLTSTSTYDVERNKGYPIILVHGYAGSDNWGINVNGENYVQIVAHVFQIAKELRAAGYQVYTADMNAFGATEDVIDENNVVIHQGRGSQLKAYMESILATTGAPKVNLIAHSQGGITSRYVISNLGMAGKVGTLITISTPHYGTEVINILDENPLLKTATESLMDLFGKIVCGDTDTSSARAHKEMTPDYMALFNTYVPDSKNIKYFSFAGKLNVPTPLNHLFAVVHLILNKRLNSMGNTEGDDGLIPVSSSKWGTFLGTLEGRKILGIRFGVDHGNEINWLNGFLISRFDAVQFYTDNAKMLQVLSMQDSSN